MSVCRAVEPLCFLISELIAASASAKFQPFTAGNTIDKDDGMPLDRGMGAPGSSSARVGLVIHRSPWQTLKNEVLLMRCFFEFLQLIFITFFKKCVHANRPIGNTV